MMMVYIGVGIGAGAASALLFASVVSGSIFSLALFFFVSLPIFVVALGWSHWAGLIAAVVAALGLGWTFGALNVPAFLISVGLPAWWLGYLALLARPAATPGDLEWYPVGRLILWAAILGALISAAAIPHFGSDAASFHAELKRGFERMLRLQAQTPLGEPLTLPAIENTDRLLDMLVRVVPPAGAMVFTMTQVLNLWLAGRIVRISGQLKRPWPHLPALTFPRTAPLVLAAAVAGSFLPDLAGIVCGMFASALLVAYAMLGLAVAHALTRTVQARPMVLAAVYATLLMFGWPVLLLIVLGLADNALNLRARLSSPGPPTVSPT